MIYPGPTSIDPGMAPDGVVVRAYSVPDAVLLFEQRMQPDDDIDEMASDAGAIAAEHDGAVCLVAFDGDSGHRIHHWPGHRSGEILR